MGALACCRAPPATGSTVAVVPGSGEEAAPVADAATRLPGPEDLAGEWRCDANGVELTVASRPEGSLHYASSESRVALLQPQGTTFSGDEIFWNTGVPVKVELRPHGSELQYRRWDLSRGRWHAPDVFRRTFPVETAARGHFVALATLWEALAAGHTVLLKGSWLLELRRAATVLPRRQDLPLGAAWEAAELQRAVEAGRVRIVALSYCWKERDHPDPEGEQLQTVAGLIEQRLAFAFPDGTCVLEDLAVFWDYPSLFQKPRSDLEQDAFDWGLLSVNLWYAHSATETWLLTRVPQGVTAYSARGWPIFERAVCGLITPADSFLDVGLWESGSKPWDEVARRCPAQREPPLRPEKAAALLKTKTFTSGADFEKVRRIYERTYYQVLSNVRCLNFSNLANWGDREAEALADCLADCLQLQELNLSADRIGAAGAAALGSAAAKCGRLRVVHMSKNPLGDEGADALFTKLARCPALERLSLGETGTGDHGAEAIAAALPRCRTLRLLKVGRCRISDAGAAALGVAVVQCAALERLEVNGNQLTAEGKEALVGAWARAAKERANCIV